MYSSAGFIGAAYLTTSTSIGGIYNTSLTGGTPGIWGASGPAAQVSGTTIDTIFTYEAA